MSGVRWHWVSEDGSQQELSEEQLIAGLSSEQIPVFALVWREGWGEWVPAMQVVELSWALPAGGADTPRKPSSGSNQPPKPDVSVYPALRERAQRIRAGEIQPTKSHSQPPPRPPPSRPLVAPKPPTAKSSPHATQADDAGVDVEVEDATVVERPRYPVLASPRKVPSETPPSMLLDTLPRPKPPTQLGWPEIPPGAMRRPVGLSQRPWTLVGLLIVGVAGVAVLVMIGSQQVNLRGGRAPSTYARPAEPEGSAAPGASAAPPAETPSLQCKLRRGRQLAEWVIPEVRPAIAQLANDKLAVGYAQTTFYALGVTIDLKTLDREYAFREYKKHTLFSVIPNQEQGQAVFTATRLSLDPAYSAALAGSSSQVVGQTRMGLALRTAGSSPRKLWPLAAASPISVPVSVRLPDQSVILALRSEGSSGSIKVGKIDAKGKALGTQLTAVESAARYVGQPSLTVRGDTTVLVFAGRKADDANWNIYVAEGKNGELPTKAKPMSLGTPNETAAFIAPLGEQSYLLLWSDRSALESVTKVVGLDAQFRILGTPAEMSTPTQFSSSAGLWAHGQDALAAYFVTTNNNTEMWGAALRCTP